MPILCFMIPLLPQTHGRIILFPPFLNFSYFLWKTMEQHHQGIIDWMILIQKMFKYDLRCDFSKHTLSLHAWLMNFNKCSPKLQALFILLGSNHCIFFFFFHWRLHWCMHAGMDTGKWYSLFFYSEAMWVVFPHFQFLLLVLSRSFMQSYLVEKRLVFFHQQKKLCTDTSHYSLAVWRILCTSEEGCIGNPTNCQRTEEILVDNLLCSSVKIGVALMLFYF